MTVLSPAIPASHLLLGDADPLFRESLVHNLRHVGFSVDEACTGPQVLQKCADAHSPDLVLLDWKLPGLSAINILSELRLRPTDVPVLILTTLDAQVYEEAALRAGAVDFVEKHRAFTILLQRIELVLAGKKRTSGSCGENADTRELRIGHLDLRPDVSRALWKGHRVDLTLSEFRALHRLVAAAGLDVSHQDIYDAIKGEREGVERNVTDLRANVRSVIKRLRQKFCAIDPAFCDIKSLSGFGYHWSAEELAAS